MAKRNRWEYRKVPYRTEKPDIGLAGGKRAFWDFLRRYLKPYRYLMLLLVFLTALHSVSPYLQNYFTQIAVDDVLQIGNVPETIEKISRGESILSRERRVEEGNPRNRSGYVSEGFKGNETTQPSWPWRRLFVLFILCVTTITAFNFLNRLNWRLKTYVAKMVSEKLREDLHEKVMSLSMSYHQSNTPGRLMARILGDVTSIHTILMDVLVSSVYELVMFVLGLTITFYINPTVALLALLSITPYLMSAVKIRKNMHKIVLEIRHTHACLWGYSSQKIDAVKAIVAYGREKLESLAFHRLSSCLVRDYVRLQSLNAKLQSGVQLFTLLGSRLITIYCAYLVLNGTMTLGTMIYLSVVINTLYLPVTTLSTRVAQFSILSVIIQRATYTLNYKQEVEEDPVGEQFPTPMHSGLKIRDLTFSWNRDLPPVLDNINLDIPVGSWLCIMGASGSGKSTLLQLIARLYDPQSGAVEIDGVDISHIKFSSLRHNLAYVPQEAQILSGTIRDNIIYGVPDATPSMIMEAADAADAHNFIMEMPVKYETVVGEKGASLSGGQRQRISIARALLTKPEILLLDDCTSALDANTERRLQETFSKILLGKTAVIVSQRVSMACRCSKIVVLEGGKIIESGTHDELIKKDGYYANLYKIQTS